MEGSWMFMWGYAVEVERCLDVERCCRCGEMSMRADA